MSEKLPLSPEHHEQLRPSHERGEQRLEQHETHEAQAENTAEALQEAREAVAEHSKVDHEHNPLKQLQEAEKAAEPASPTFVTRELKNMALARELKNIQRKLPAPERVLSKVIHQPVVRVVSEVAGKSVSRPSGLLGGGLVAFIGSCGYLYLAKHIGFTYNYLIFSMLFVAGFAVGLVLELVVWTLTAKRRKQLS